MSCHIKLSYPSGALINIIVFLCLIICLWCSKSVYGREIIRAKEIDSYMYSEGKMKKSAGQYEITYLVESDKIVRMRVYNYINNKVESDDVVYKIQSQLKGYIPEEQSVRALGYPGVNSIEILVFDGQYIRSVRSSANYFIITNMIQVK